jgi:hypothetical protein
MSNDRESPANTMKTRIHRLVGLWWVYGSTSVRAFGVSRQRNHPRLPLVTPSPTSVSSSVLLLAAKRDDEEEDERVGDGMERAFRELDALKSLDDGKPKPKIDDNRKGFAKAMEDLEKEDLNAPPPAPPEAEVKLYSDMVTELEGKDEDVLYSDMLSDMGGKAKAKQVSAPVIEDASLDVPITSSSEDMDAFMNKALKEAVDEARKKTPKELAASAENILDDKEMMKEIEEVFDKANKELLDSLEEIRREQVSR